MARDPAPVAPAPSRAASAAAGRPDLHARFLAAVQRGLERADREEREYRAALRPERARTPAERRRTQGRILFRPRSTPVPDPADS